MSRWGARSMSQGLRVLVLVKKIKSIKLDAHDPRLFHMLGEISSEEDTAGRGMLTVVVVHKVGDMQPGPGFFELAKHLGRDTTGSC
jgi:molybdopterin synthase catalytic subunit